MKIFLTSDAGGVIKNEDGYFPCRLDQSNQFADRLKAALPEPADCLLISSDPDDDEMNDGYRYLMKEAFRLNGISLSNVTICDRRNCSAMKSLVEAADLIILCGGHVPTQNRFFKDGGLAQMLKSYDGVIVGISAGSMNSASLVYAHPELDGEAADPAYERFLTGLGLTDITILPHYQELAGATLDGLRLIEDIAIPDSCRHPFYALPDGSYVYIEDGNTEFCGSYYYFHDGTVEPHIQES